MSDEMETIEIRHHFSGVVLYSAQVSVSLSSLGLKIGAAVKLAVKARADLAGANLSGANLASANLSGANLAGAKIDPLTAARTSIVPDEGDYTGWKKCRGDVLVKLLIPAAAKRSNATGRKCRAEFVRVLEVFGADVGISQHDGITEYRAGKEVRCDSWNDNRWDECSCGIHHFITRVEAENY